MSWVWRDPAGEMQRLFGVHTAVQWKAGATEIRADYHHDSWESVRARLEDRFSARISRRF